MRFIENEKKIPVAFSFFTRFQFQRIERRIARGQYLRIDHQFNNTLLHQSILAILLFAVNIYGLNLSSFLAGMAPFRAIPTLLALLFLLAEPLFRERKGSG